MSYGYGKSIVTDGLVFYVDAANSKSYDGSAGGTTWTDLVGGNDGTLTNMDTNPASGGYSYDSANGGSVSFDGVDDYVRLLGSSNKQVFSFSTSATFSAWVYPVANDNMILVKRNNGLGWEIQLDSSGLISWYFNSSGGIFFDTNDGTAVSLNTWNNIVVVLDRNTNVVSRYLNSNATGTNTNVSGLTSLSDNTTDVSIGGRYARNDKYFGGKISNVQIYNRALSSAEILQNYNALKNRFV